MEVVDVAVIGAGPAGAAAAIDLARGGCDVAVFDKATFPRDKCCGDGLTTGALRELEDLGLSPSGVASWTAIHGFTVRSPSGRTVEFPFPAGGLFGAVSRRRDLDAALVDLARAAGAKVHEGCGFEDLRWSDDGVIVRLEGREAVAARYVIGADGMWSPVRKSVGLAEPGYLGEWHAFRQYLRTDREAARRLWVWFEPDLLPGYAWSFPLPGGTVNVGFGIRRTPGAPTRSMAETWRHLLEVPHIRDVLGSDPQPEAAHRAWPIPARLPQAVVRAAGGRVLLVGDAARATDPMTGEGIGQALETGRAAARAILEAGPTGAAAAGGRYERHLRRSLGVDHRLAGALSSVLASSAGARGAIRLAGASAWTRRNFARWLFEDYPRALLVTPGRWRPGMLGRPGAFTS